MAIGTFSQIIAYFIFVAVLCIALTMASVFVLRRREGGGDATGYRTPGYPFTPPAFLSLVAVLLFLLAVQNPRQAGLGVGVVALGWPVYRAAFKGVVSHDGSEE